MILFETERTVVKRFTLLDDQFFFDVNGNAEVVRFIRPPKSREDSNIFLKENINFYRDGSILGRFAVFTKDDGIFLGTFSYLYLSGEADFHLGYALVPGAWGRGYATELVRQGILYFFQQTNKPTVFAITSAGNIASQRVLLKTGFQYKGQSEEDGKALEIFYINRNLDTTAHIQGT